MNDRSAVDTIKGYFYQFDLSIKKILELPTENDYVDIECIEDIDIYTVNDTTATQCKYYAKTEYNHSVIKPAVMHMLSHYKNNNNAGSAKIEYYIYGHYASGQEKLNWPISLDFLKENFLTYTKSKVTHYHHLELGLSNQELQDFLSRITIDNNSISFEQQFNEIINLLTTKFKCKQFEAEYFYYNNALRIIREKSILQNPSDRRLTKKDFLTLIDTSKILFDVWFVAKKGKIEHFKKLRETYFSPLNISKKNRLFLIDATDQTIQLYQIIDVISVIQKKWSKISKYEPSPFCPFIHVYGLPDDKLFLLKKTIYQNIKFIDGFDYHSADFNPISLLTEPSLQNSIKLKFIHKLEHVTEIINASKQITHIFQFYTTIEFFNYENTIVKHLKIQISSIEDIKEIV